MPETRDKCCSESSGDGSLRGDERRSNSEKFYESILFLLGPLLEVENRPFDWGWRAVGLCFPASAVVRAAVPAAVCLWGLCPCCPDVGRCLSGGYNHHH